MSKNRLKKLHLVRPAEATMPERMPGKVTHDARGNAVWDWDIATGVLAHKSVKELLTHLDAPGALTLDGEPEVQGDWSGDPYNRTR
jgi:hypothetical protein